MSCELVLVAGGLCDSPGYAMSANPSCRVARCSRYMTNR